MEAVLDGLRIASIDELHRQLEQALRLPSHYGRNLDALWDAVSGMLERPLRLTWLNSDVSRQRLGADFDAVVGVLRRAEQQDVEYGWDDRFELSLL